MVDKERTWLVLARRAARASLNGLASDVYAVPCRLVVAVFQELILSPGSRFIIGSVVRYRLTTDALVTLCKGNVIRVH